MLCCIIPMTVAAIVTFVTGSTAAMFSGPMLYVTIGMTAISMGVMAYYGWKLFSKYVLGNNPDSSCCDTSSQTPSCCNSKGKTSSDFEPAPLPKLSDDVTGDMDVPLLPEKKSDHGANI